MLKTEDIRIRDPYVVAENGNYYLYSSSFVKEQLKDYDEKCLYMVVYQSADLKEWSDPKVVFQYEVTEESELRADFWAPEIHRYNNKFYAFMSFLNRRGIRGTYIAAADTPDEPLFADNGGHAMFFTDFDGSLKMCIHHPESPLSERLCCLEAEEINGTIKLKP